jgi:cation transport ATPase
VADGILPIARYFVRESVGKFPSLPGSHPKAAKSRRSAAPRYRRAGETVIYLLVIRQGSRAALARLKALGVRAMMLTGHATAVARWVARELALDEFFAEVLPD